MKEKNRKVKLRTRDFLVSGEAFDLIIDSERAMLVTSPAPLSELEKYYKSNAYISHSDSRRGIFNLLYQLVKKNTLRQKASLIHALNTGAGKLLDIGAGTGEFILQAQKNGWEVQGVEPNAKARRLASEKGVSLRASLEDLQEKKYDVVTLWHVLEHLPNLEASIARITSLIKPEGILVVAVPNYKSFDAKYYKQYWAGYDVPRHLWHFSRESMDRLFPENIRLKKTKPMYFDSFYVSLLSEKYKSGSSFSFKALAIGFWSNLRALRTNEFSSLIYCYSKDEK